MTALPVIVGMGGINAAGRTSFHQGYRRIVLDSLDAKARQETFLGLATLMNLVKLEQGKLVDQQGQIIEQTQIESTFGEQIIAGTLIRKIEKNHFDVDATPWQQKMTLSVSNDEKIVFETRARDLPQPVPASWQVEQLEGKKVKVTIAADLEVKHNSTRDNPIKAAVNYQQVLNLGQCTIAVISHEVYKQQSLPLLMPFVQQGLIGNIL